MNSNNIKIKKLAHTIGSVVWELCSWILDECIKSVMWLCLYNHIVVFLFPSLPVANFGQVLEAVVLTGLLIGGRNKNVE